METNADIEKLKARVKLLKLALELAEAELIRARFNDPDPKLQEGC